MKRYIKSARSNPQFKTVYVSQEYVPDYGWEDIVVYDDTSDASYSEAKQDVKDYKDNGYNARVIKRKLNNPEYVEPDNNITYNEAVEWVNNSPYEVKELYSMDGKNYILEKDGKFSSSVQIFIGEDDTVRVRNVSGNRTKQVRSIEELEKEVSRIINR